MTLEELRIALPDTISTPDLLLRAPRPGDVDAMQRLADNEKIYRVLARLPHPYEKEHAVDFINNLARTEQEHAYAIVQGGRFIGVIGLHLKGDRAPELGYWLGEPHWGHGFATQAAIAVVGAARAIDSNLTLYSRALSSNLGSRRVLVKAGFVETEERIDNCGPNIGVPVTFMELAGGTRDEQR